jgi:predicted DNA-binding protein with PD1-like motif
MRNAAIAAAVLAAGILSGQQVRREVVKPSPGSEDAKPNSDKVPDVYAISGQFDRVVVLRFKYEADLLAGIEKMVEQQHIRNGVILAGAGSVRNYQVHSVSNRTFPSKNMYVKDPAAPADIISMNGYIINGKVHAHMTMANAEHAFGGHLEPGTNVFTFAVVTIGVFGEGVDLGRVDDKTYR